ncbi:hypothetical protein AB0L70_13320 [Kribbella sp. NPDC051952]|uniref:hypothetical protein n=1 Tax=Kribbella sp. NPDC051952 TaxID=3154851 RepID=UPI0034306597
MTSKAAKRAKRRAKRNRAARRRGLDFSDLPRPLRLMMESQQELAGYIERATDLPSASALALANLRQSVSEIVDKMRNHDSLDVLESIVYLNLMSDPEEYRETDHEGSAAVVELVALIAGSGTVVGNAAQPGAYDMKDQPEVDGVQACGMTALNAASKWRLFEALQDENPTSGLSFQTVIRETSLRNTSYPHMLRQTLDAIFSHDDVIADCVAATGSTPTEIFRVLDAAYSVRERRWNERLLGLERVHAIYLRWQEGDRSELTEAEAIEALGAVWANPANAAILDIPEVAAETGLPPDKIESILDLFTSSLEHDSAVDLVERFFRGDNPLRLRPILRHPSGRRLVVHESLLLPAFRERIEEALKIAGRTDRYLRRRAKDLEDAALSHLKSMLPNSIVHGSFEYFIPHPEKPNEVEPSSFTKFVESDGLIIVDDVALIVEAKSGALSQRARSGDSKRLGQDLTKLVSDAASQAERMRERITKDGGLRLRNRTWLDLSGIREIYSVTITLDDLAGIVTVTDELVRAGLLPGINLPWTVSIHDLRIIGELVERPAELLLYLRRRTLPELTRTFLATDELDFFLHMLRAGLYVEPDPEILAREIPNIPPTADQRRRFKKQRTQFLTSRTVPLDDWYFYQLGSKKTPAEKPRLNVQADLLRLVDEIRDSGLPGWLSTSTSLLSCDETTRQDFIEYGSKLAQATRIDRQPHTLTVILGDRRQNFTVLVWACRPSNVTKQSFDRHHLRYLAAKKHQAQALRAAIIVFNEDGTFSHLLFDNREPGPNPELDADVSTFGLTKLTDMNRAQTMRRLTKILGD